MESFERGGYIHDKYRASMRQNMAKKMAGIFQEGGLHSVADYLLDVFNVNLIYEKDERSEERKKLNLESGLIISNHPGGIDTPAIIKTLTRDSNDLKIVTTPRGYKEYGEAFGRELFISIPSGDNPSDARNMVQSIIEHIEGHGGIVLIYPSGRMGKMPDAGFQSGFRRILEKITEDKMVYCFNFKDEEIKKITRGVGKLGIYSEGLAIPINPYKLRRMMAVNVAEKYTQAGEWKSLINNSPVRQVNKALKDHYSELFSG